jgi:flagellar biosynthesis GTPase FlhF
MKEKSQAYICHSEWIVGESKREGKKMIKNLLELIRLAFENQCKSVLQEAKHNNMASLEKKIISAFEKINKWSAVTHCEIAREYLDLRIRELHLRCELEEIKQKEKEQQQEIRKQQRETEKKQRESEKARKEIEEFEERKRLHQQELDRIRQEVRQTEGEKQKQLELRIQQLEQQVVQDECDIEDATSRYRRAKEGHIYVVSNFGSFGREDIYRIFMTTSANEDDYVRSMNPLVPFPFDIHFKIYSEEPSDIIKSLHQRFQNRRVNLDNERRDFFRVPLDEIEQAVEEIRQEKGGMRTLEFARQPQNLEYFRSLSLERKKQK